MLVADFSTNVEKMATSPIKKYDRDLLIRIGNQPVSVFAVPESFLELAKEAGASSPTRPLGPPVGPPGGIVPPHGRGLSRGSSGSGLYGGSIRNSSGNGLGGFGLFGPLVVPPPPPASKEPKKVITLKTQEKLLQSSPNAWKPGRLKPRESRDKEEEPKTEEELIIEGIVKETRGMLNKLTPENFDRLMEKFMNKIPLENKEGRVAAVINVLFEKAIDEPAFSAAYAKMVQTVCSTSAETSRIFKKQILDKCQHEFQRSDSEEDKVTELMEKLKVTEAEEKEKVQAEIEDLKSTMRKRALGNVRFIGELYKLHMLTPKIMVSCVRLLLTNPDDEKLESLCKLLSTVGKKLDDQLKDLEVKAKKEGKPGPEEKLMEKFFAQLDKLSGDKKICSRIRFAIMDLVELRQNQWTPRRQATGPKTIEEVHRDAYLQELEEKRHIQSLPPSSAESPGGRGQHHSNHMNSPMSHVPKKSDWTTVQNKAARFQRKPSETTKTGPQSFAPPTGPMFGAR